MTDEEVVRASVAAYLTGDREAADRLFAADFTFTSPQDDHIDRIAWFERCFPTAHRFSSHELLEVVTTDAGLLSLYEYELHTGERYRNAELAVVRDGRITEVQVFFGGAV
jgi:ketosteroid isomerase-like protein